MTYLFSTKNLSRTEMAKKLMEYPQSFREDTVDVRCSAFNQVFSYDTIRNAFIPIKKD